MKGVSSVEISPDAWFVASGDHGGDVWIWDLVAGKCFKQYDLKKMSDFENPYTTSLAFNPNEFCLAVANSDKIIWYFDLESGDLINKSYADVHPIYKI